MKHITKALVLASALAATGLAQAQTASATLVAGGPPVSAFGWTMKDLQGGGTLTFSESLMGALDVAGIVTTAAGPATVTSDGVTISAAAPVLTMSGELDMGANTFTATNVRTMGGALMTAAKKNFATTTGSLSVTGITVDLTTKAIFADLTGANGVGTVNGVHVWNYANIAGPTVFPVEVGVVNANNTLTGLTITSTAFDLFGKSLGLTAGGKAAMQSIDDYGTMVASINVTVVPEPSTYALMGLGLVGLAFAAKRARRA